jgi:hypothetical protein
MSEHLPFARVEQARVIWSSDRYEGRRRPRVRLVLIVRPNDAADPPGADVADLDELVSIHIEERSHDRLGLERWNEVSGTEKRLAILEQALVDAHHFGALAGGADATAREEARAERARAALEAIRPRTFCGVCAHEIMGEATTTPEGVPCHPECAIALGPKGGDA